MLLGTPNVFTVDQRTRVILSHMLRKEGASPEDIQRALVRYNYHNSISLQSLSDLTNSMQYKYLAALSQVCNDGTLLP